MVVTVSMVAVVAVEVHVVVLDVPGVGSLPIEPGPLPLSWTHPVFVFPLQL